MQEYAKNMQEYSKNMRLPPQSASLCWVVPATWYSEGSVWLSWAIILTAGNILCQQYNSNFPCQEEGEVKVYGQPDVSGFLPAFKHFRVPWWPLQYTESCHELYKMSVISLHARTLVILNKKLHCLPHPPLQIALIRIKAQWPAKLKLLKRTESLIRFYASPQDLM